MPTRRPTSVRRQRFAVAAVLAGFLISGCEPPRESGSRGTLTDRLGDGDTSGFARAQGPREFVFPADHGPHPDYRNEWWYLTGNLEAAGGRRFGYQVTFFRVALAPAEPVAEARRSGWATRQVWMAHIALSDAAKRHHWEHERLARGAAGLAGARAEPFRVWLEDWQLGSVPNGTDQTWQLRIDAADFDLDLVLEPLKSIILQGEAGLSRKSAEPGNASYYYSIPRLKTKGSIGIGGERLPVGGLSWLDREWSTSALGVDQTGWDWFALQLDDGSDLMFYQLRRTDGRIDPHSAGTLISPDGDIRKLAANDVRVEPQRWWSATDGVRYPVVWMLQLVDGPAYRVEAVFEDQRMDTTVAYWEGMVEVFDIGSGERLGRGYLELAGYE